VREVGRGSGMEERSLEIGEVLGGGGRRWWRHEAGLKNNTPISQHTSADFRDSAKYMIR